MREIDDTTLELELRSVLATRLGSLPLDLTPEAVEQRRVIRARARRRRNLLVLGLAAAMMLPLGWLVAGAPLPRENDATVVVDPRSPTPHPEPTPIASTTPTPDASETPGETPDVVTAGGLPDLLIVTDVRRKAKQTPCDNLDRYDIATGAHRAVLTCADRIAMTADRTRAAVGDPRGIRIVDLETGAQVDFIDLREPAYPITWSPSGRWLEWAACGSENDTSDPCKVTIGSPDNAERHRLPGGEGGGYLCCVYWPPDETLVAVPADGIDAFAIGYADGSDLRPMTDDDPLATYLLATRYDPGRMSPDGSQFLDVVTPYVNGQNTAPELWLAATTGGGRRNLAALELGARVLGTAWSPDGGTIAISKLPEGGANQLWLLGLDGSLRLLAAPEGFQWGSAALPGQWSPDGTRLAIGVLRGDPADTASQSVDTVIVPIDGSAAVTLRDARQAQWSPDGASIAFVATTGPYDHVEGDPVQPATIAVANGDGSNRHLVVDPGGNEFWFTWAAP